MREGSRATLRTDYELGAGVLLMPVRLALDTTIGSGLISAGFSMRREPALTRVLLVEFCLGSALRACRPVGFGPAPVGSRLTG